jgi:hypothetical protein
MSDLHTIALMFRGGERQVNLVFSSESQLEAAIDKLVPVNAPHITDSYGTRVWLMDGETPCALEAVIAQDAGRVSEDQIEIGLLQTRSQTKMQRRAAGDPMINLNSTRSFAPGGH